MEVVTGDGAGNSVSSHLLPLLPAHDPYRDHLHRGEGRGRRELCAVGDGLHDAKGWPRNNLKCPGRGLCEIDSAWKMRGHGKEGTQERKCRGEGEGEEEKKERVEVNEWGG